ncbi:MAG: DivIVA domain-containing protein [Actinobacteria bacterium]|nr:DivIVA domain-containing protein [Actinomycetota bacterium]
MSDTGSSIQHLRTVEFRETLRGYNRDDVDEFLERVAVEVDALQQQLVQLADQARNAMEQTAMQARVEPASDEAAAEASQELQRTLLMAQRFVEHAKQEADAQANDIVNAAEARARAIVAEAEEAAAQIGTEAERSLRDEVRRLESSRTELAADVEAMSRYLEAERTRLRSGLSELLKWVEENLQPAAPMAAPRRPSNPAAGSQPGRSTEAPGAVPSPVPTDRSQSRPAPVGAGQLGRSRGGEGVVVIGGGRSGEPPSKQPDHPQGPRPTERDLGYNGR